MLPEKPTNDELRLWHDEALNGDFEDGSALDNFLDALDSGVLARWPVTVRGAEARRLARDLIFRAAIHAEAKYDLETALQFAETAGRCLAPRPDQAAYIQRLHSVLRPQSSSEDRESAGKDGPRIRQTGNDTDSPSGSEASVSESISWADARTLRTNAAKEKLFHEFRRFSLRDTWSLPAVDWQPAIAPEPEVSIEAPSSAVAIEPMLVPDSTYLAEAVSPAGFGAKISARQAEPSPVAAAESLEPTSISAPKFDKTSPLTIVSRDSASANLVLDTKEYPSERSKPVAVHRENEETDVLPIESPSSNERKVILLNPDDLDANYRQKERTHESTADTEKNTGLRSVFSKLRRGLDKILHK